jgi:hypothetical protein
VDAKIVKAVMTHLSALAHKSMTPEQRSARAKKASDARWAKDKAKA